MSNQIDIITIGRDRGAAALLQRLRREAISVRDDIDRAFDIDDPDVKVNVDDSEIVDANQRVADLDGNDPRIKPQVDDSEVKAADRDIRDLDSIPPPEVKPKVSDSALSGMTGRIEGALENVDAESAGRTMIDQISAGMSVIGPLGVVATGVGVLVGEQVVDGFNRGFRGGRNTAFTAVQRDLDPARVQELGDISGRAYSAGFGSGTSDMVQVAALLEAELADIDDGFDMTRVQRQAQAVEQIFGVDIPQSTLVVKRAVANNLVRDSVEGFNLVAFAAQKLPLQANDALDAYSEFSPVFRRMGVDGGRAMTTIVNLTEKGLVPNVDRAAELFEEFNIQLTETDSLREPIQQLGLDFEEMQRLASDGRGAEVLARISDELLGMDDLSRRNAIAMDIFAMSIESAGDVGEILAELSLADEIADIGTAADDASKAIEQNVTSLDRARGHVESLAFAYGSALANELNEVASGIEMVTGLFSSNEEASDGVAKAMDRTNKVMDQQGDQATDTAGEIEGLADRVAQLDEALSAFSSRFTTDDVFRSIEADASSLVDTTAELEGATFDLATGFDNQTDAGRRAEAAAERLSGNLDKLIRGQQEGTVTASELAFGQARVQGSLRQVASQMGLTQAQTQVLIDKYGTVPNEVTTTVRVNDQASNILQLVRNRMNTIAQGVTGTVRVTAGRSFSSSGRTSGGRQRREAGGIVGGMQTGGVARRTIDLPDELANDPTLTLVGEGGPELARLAPGSQVVSNPDTRSLFERSSGGGPTYNIYVTTGAILSNRDVSEVIREEIERTNAVGGLERAV